MRRRRFPGRRRAGLALLGATATGLIAAGVLLPELPRDTGVVDAAAAAVAADTAPAESTSVVASPQLVVPVPAAPVGPTFVVPAPAPRQFQLPRPWVPHGVAPKLHPPSAPCGGSFTPRKIPPQVVPGTAAATLSWMADDHPDVQGYRISAVSQRLVPGSQPAPPSADVAQVSGCRTVTGQLTGLSSGTYYVFWLEEAQRDATSGVVRYVQVGSSDPVLIG